MDGSALGCSCRRHYFLVMAKETSTHTAIQSEEGKQEYSGENVEEIGHSVARAVWLGAERGRKIHNGNSSNTKRPWDISAKP